MLCVHTALLCLPWQSTALRSSWFCAHSLNAMPNCIGLGHHVAFPSTCMMQPAESLLLKKQIAVPEVGTAVLTCTTLGKRNFLVPFLAF